VAVRVPVRLQLRTWIALNCVLADTQKQRGRRAADNALQLARQLDPSEANRFLRYHALCRAASAAAQTDDLPRAQALLDEIRAIEDPAWPAQRLVWGAEAAQWIARMSGDTAAALLLGHRLLLLDRRRGSDAVIAAGNLVDAELAAGDAQGAAQTGAALVEALLATRHEYSLAFARINLLAAWLALDDRERARAAGPVTWEKAVMFNSQHAAAAYLAVLAALDGRPRAAARIVGYSEAQYAARAEARERNETAATERARALARAALGDAEFERQRNAGEALGETDIAAIAFGSADQ
jgi:hypothetical protein